MRDRSEGRAALDRETPWIDGTRSGPCRNCGLPATQQSGKWPVHVATGNQNCSGGVR